MNPHKIMLNSNYLYVMQIGTYFLDRFMISFESVEKKSEEKSPAKRKVTKNIHNNENDDDKS